MTTVEIFAVFPQIIASGLCISQSVRLRGIADSVITLDLQFGAESPIELLSRINSAHPRPIQPGRGVT